mmetsp:Transcript_9680/g.21550  ORF Transcript_9680/g.21550 Transcript_9680/m.21550 type:complete len:267 (+) Transcript_9680:5-805(+)
MAAMYSACPAARQSDTLNTSKFERSSIALSRVPALAAIRILWHCDLIGVVLTPSSFVLPAAGRAALLGHLLYSRFNLLLGRPRRGFLSLAASLLLQFGDISNLLRPPSTFLSSTREVLFLALLFVLQDHGFGSSLLTALGPALPSTHRRGLPLRSSGTRAVLRRRLLIRGRSFCSLCAVLAVFLFTFFLNFFFFFSLLLNFFLLFLSFLLILFIFIAFFLLRNILALFALVVLIALFVFFVLCVLSVIYVLFVLFVLFAVSFCLFL